MATASATEPPEINDLDRDGWDDAWVAAYPEVDLDQPLADLNGDGMPVYLEMHLGSDPFAEIEGKEKSAAQEYEEWQRRLIAKIRKMEEVRARTDHLLRRGFRDENGDICCPEEYRRSKLRRLEPLRERMRAEAVAREQRIDTWLAENEATLSDYVRKNRPSDIVDGRPKWVGAQSLSIDPGIRIEEIWPGSSWLVGDPAGLDVYDQSLTGAGQKIFVWDIGGVRESHEQFEGRVTNSTDQDNDGVPDSDPLGETDHATAVVGVIAGGGEPSRDHQPGTPAPLQQITLREKARGNAFDAEVVVLDDTLDAVEIAFLLPDSNAGLHLSNHSYGLKCGWEWDKENDIWLWHAMNAEQEDPSFGQYRERESSVDQTVYAALTYLPVFSAGNHGDNIPAETQHNDTGESPDHGPDTFVLHEVVGENGARTPGNGFHQPDGTAGFFFPPLPLSDCIPPQAAGKNVLTVGVDGYAAGPTDDGRLKPDIVIEPLTSFSTDQGALGKYPQSHPMEGMAADDAYGNISGSSFASASVTGGLALLREQWEVRRGSGAPKPWGSTLKAVAIATACDVTQPDAGPTGIDYVGPDYFSGHGEFRLSLAAELLEVDSEPDQLHSHPHVRQVFMPFVPDGPDSGEDGDGVIEMCFVRNAETETYPEDGLVCQYADHFIVAVCWSDPGEGAHLSNGLDDSTSNLVNDLDAVVIAPGGAEHRPWILNPDNPGEEARRGAHQLDTNETDNVEVIRVDLAPGTGHGTYTLRITHKDLLEDGMTQAPAEPLPQPVSVVVAGARFTAARFEITEIAKSGLGSEHRITFGSVPGATYQLERSTDAETWTPVGVPVIADLDETAFDHAFDTANLQAEFVRVRNLCGEPD